VESSLTGSLSTFRVNKTTAGEQERPQVAMLHDGGAVFVWQGGVVGAQRIFARFMTSEGTFRGDDVRVNAFNQEFQQDPAVAVLSGGDVVVVWSSYGQDGSMLGVYGQRFSPTGSKIGTEFPVNQWTPLNQRTPAVAALEDGGFLVVWVSERELGVQNATDANGQSTDAWGGAVAYSVHLYGRRYSAEGAPASDQFLINETDNLICANPVLGVAGDGSILAAWSGRTAQFPTGTTPSTDSWDVFGRFLTLEGAPEGSDFQINTHSYGDQFHPKVASLGQDYLVVWTSLGQDGSREGIYGRQVNAFEGNGPEFRVNSTTPGQQFLPAVASNGEDRLLVIWSGFVGGANGYDLQAQRYTTVEGLPAPDAPLITALSQTRLSVSWPDMAGYDVEAYEIYVDGSSESTSVEGNLLSVGGFSPGTEHTFRLAYRLADGRRSPLSPVGSGQTWGSDENFDGLPDDWQAVYWGNNASAWPSPIVDSDGDGASNLQEFLAGTDPTDAASVLKVQILADPYGLQIVWNTQPGLIYQLQSSSDAADWAAHGNARFAAGSSDSVVLNGGANVLFYRIIRLR
jgi:hypothetical protein